jgi:hypothetical protein
MASAPYILSLLAASLFVAVAIPVLSWRGRPRGFSRVNWFGTALGGFFFAIVFAVSANVVGDALRETANKMEPPYQEMLKAQPSDTNKVAMQALDGSLLFVPRESVAETTIERGAIVVQGTGPYLGKKRNGVWVNISRWVNSAEEWPGLLAGRDLRVAEYERAERRADFWPSVLGILSGLFAAVGIGSLLAIFFHRNNA